MRLNDQICGANGDSRIPSDLKDEIRNAEKKIKDWGRQIQENLRRMEAKGKEWEDGNTRLSRQVVFVVLDLVAVAVVAWWYWA